MPAPPPLIPRWVQLRVWQPTASTITCATPSSQHFFTTTFHLPLPGGSQRWSCSRSTALVFGTGFSDAFIDAADGHGLLFDGARKKDPAFVHANSPPSTVHEANTANPTMI